MNAFFGFIASPAGRVTRIIAGLALILVGLPTVGGIWSWILAIVGLVPLLAGLFKRCVFAPVRIAVCRAAPTPGVTRRRAII